MAKMLKETEVSIKRGDLKSLKNQLLGPIKVYLDSGRRDENGTLITQTIEDSEGNESERPEREEEPFLVNVYAYKNYMTPTSEDEFKLLREGEEYKGRPGHSAIGMLSRMIKTWDLVDDGVPVPVTVEGMTKHEIPSEVLYSILNACYEYNRPPKVLSGPSLPVSSQEE